MAKSENPKEAKARKDFLKSAAETLQETKKQLLKEMQGRVKGESEGSKDEGRDTYDLASDERDREINFILNDREREKLHAIDEALLEIDSDSELEAAKELAIARMSRLSGLDTDARSRRVAGFLSRKGYSSNVVWAAIRFATDSLSN